MKLKEVRYRIDCVNQCPYRQTEKCFDKESGVIPKTVYYRCGLTDDLCDDNNYFPEDCPLDDVELKIIRGN